MPELPGAPAAMAIEAGSKAVAAAGAAPSRGHVGADVPDPAPPPPAPFDATAAWADAVLAATLLAIAPHALGGIHLRAAAGPVRDRWLEHLADALHAADGSSPAPRPAGAPWRKLPLSIADDRLLGGLDLTATLAAGRPVSQRGLLAEADGRVIVVPMAERLGSSVAAQLALALDRGEVVVAREGVSARSPARFGLVALDEGGADDDPFAPALGERLAFTLDLRPLGLRDVRAAERELPDLPVVARDPALHVARERLAQVRVPDETVEALCAAALALGVASLRASWFAVQAARAHAAWQGRDRVDDDDAAWAVRLVLAGRATRLPVVETEPPEAEPGPPEEPAEPPPDAARDEPPPPEGQSDTEPPPAIPDAPLEDRLLEAALAAMPPGLLARLLAGDPGRGPARSSGKAGQARLGGRRGRPAGIRREMPAGHARLSLIDTLRAAAPWQKLRQSVATPAAAAGRAGRDAPARAGSAWPPGAGRVRVRPEDFHVRRHQQRSATTTVFAVDASGSQALHRLAEAKGAVELMLAECYVRRDSVAMVAFRGTQAEVLLPPTRSLVRAKKSLAGLPGGGGTPLAAGLDAAFGVADAVRRRGDTPMLVLLTDGRANIARDGSPGRPQAEADARRAARQWRAAGLRSLLIDTAPQSQPLARQLALEMGATYLALPHADARALSGAVAAVQRTGAAPGR